jgi:predicted TIM-barrel fold metal-dependent hydrolase
MLIDGLVVTGPNLFADAALLPAALEQATANGIDGIVAAPGRPPDYSLPPANDRLAEECSGLRNVAHLGRVDPLQGQRAATEARRCLLELGCAGLFLHPGEEAFPLSEATAVVKVAAAEGVPVVVAAGLYGMSEPLQFLELARSVPDATIVMTSGGQINISGLSMIDAWAALTRAANLRVLSNGEYRQDFLERIVGELGAERLLFGSFSPYHDQGFEVARIENVGIEPGARGLVLGGNAQGLFGLMPPSTHDSPGQP